MSTVALRCPYCGAWMRVAVQPSSITRHGVRVDYPEQLKVTFDAQVVAHICQTKDREEGEGDTG